VDRKEKARAGRKTDTRLKELRRKARESDVPSLRPLLENPKAPWSNPAFTQVVHGEGGRQVMDYSVRTERWRYSEWDGGAAGAELYDQDADPHEYRNLANNPKYAGQVAELKALLPKAKPADIPGQAGKKKKKAK
jgi:arylsulfatase A-like enzyme